MVRPRNVVQADPSSFLHAGDARSEAEIKGFVRRWVIDAFSWRPLDVEDRLRACLSVVDGKAKPVAKAGFRLAERRPWSSTARRAACTTTAAPAASPRS